MELFDYSENTQKFFIDFMVSSPESFSRCQNIISDKYFDTKFRSTIRFIKEYVNEYNSIPKIKQIKAQTGHECESIDDIKPQDESWFLDSIEQFCRHKALEIAIYKAPDQLEKKNYGAVEQNIQQAMLISLQKELGTKYYDNPLSRLEEMKDKSSLASTGWKVLDDVLYGGFNYGLHIFAGGSGTGKSLWLQNLALNWSEQGKDVVYFTFELSEELVAMRFDSMISGFASKHIFRNMEEVSMKVKQAKKDRGSIIIKYMPAGSCTNDIKAYLKEYEIQCGKLPDGILVDYLDLLHPNNSKVSVSDLFVKDKHVSEEIRSVSIENEILLASASQLNRESTNELEHDHSHIAGGISKINTADNVMTIHISNAMRDRGEYQLQFLKTRSSAGVGRKIKFEFNIDTLRIQDPEDEEEPENIKSDIAAKIKGQTKINSHKSHEIEKQHSTEKKSEGNEKINKMRAMINNINGD